MWGAFCFLHFSVFSPACMNTYMFVSLSALFSLLQNWQGNFYLSWGGPVWLTQWQGIKVQLLTWLVTKLTSAPPPPTHTLTHTHTQPPPPPPPQNWMLKAHFLTAMPNSWLSRRKVYLTLHTWLWAWCSQAEHVTQVLWKDCIRLHMIIWA